MAKAIEAGMPKLRIEEAAARTQARIDSGRQPVIGVNKYRLDAGGADRRAQGRQRGGARRSRPRSCAGCARERDEAACQAALDALTRRRGRRRHAAGLTGNLLALAIDAARAKATVGEISDALEKVYGRTPGDDPDDLAASTGRRRARSDSDRADPRGRRPSSSGPRAAGRASWSPRWARTATTAGRR